MKRLFILLCSVTSILTGCTLPFDKGKDEFVPTEASMYGAVVSIRPVEVNVTHEVDGSTISEIIQYNDVEFSNSDGGEAAEKVLDIAISN